MGGWVSDNVDKAGEGQLDGMHGEWVEAQSASRSKTVSKAISSTLKPSLRLRVLNCSCQARLWPNAGAPF